MKCFSDWVVEVDDAMLLTTQRSLTELSGALECGRLHNILWSAWNNGKSASLTVCELQKRMRKYLSEVVPVSYTAAA